MAWVKEGLALYQGRIGRYTNFSVDEIPELKGAASLTREQIKEREGELILKRVQPNQELILLDDKGKEYTSLDFASWLGERLSRDSREMVFAIGGAYGFSREVYSRADLMISLSRMTFSHQMVRTIFAEQLYRAFTILRSEPYHHE